MTDRKLRTLIIGAGGRVQNNFLPALRYLDDRFSISGIHSRTAERLSAVAQRWGVPAIPSLAPSIFDALDVVVVSVPTSQNPIVLGRLIPAANSVHLVIDTPVAWSDSERAEIEPLLQRFPNVTVTEDYMNFPRFNLTRSIARRGLLGPIRSLTLTNIGFLYHGLALIRSFCGFEPVSGSWRHSQGRSGVVVGYQLPNGFAATVIGPYRRHTSGGLLLEGDEGVLTEFPIDRDLSPAGKPVHILSAVRDGGLLTGFQVSLQGGKERYFLNLPEIRAMRAMDFADKSEINLERGCGLIEVFRSVAGDHNINQGYGAKNALYDLFVSRRATDGLMPLDPFRTFEQSGINWISESRTFLKASTAVASSLPPNEIIEVETSTVVTSERFERVDDHVRLFGVKLNGQTLPAQPWFIYGPAWALR